MTDRPTVIVPKNTLHRIDEIFVFVSSDEAGEGVCAGPLEGPRSLVPLIAADQARLKSLIPIAPGGAAERQARHANQDGDADGDHGNHAEWGDDAMTLAVKGLSDGQDQT